MAARTSSERWTFLTNHARVLIWAARWPDARVRDIAKRVDITERQVHAILKDLETAGYLSREHVGRRNHYRVNAEARFRHESAGSVRVGDFLELFEMSRGQGRRTPVRLAI